MTLAYNETDKRFQGDVKSPFDDRKLRIDSDASFTLEDVKTLQVMANTMIGGGMLGSFAMGQPADFYIDDRVGKLPYSRRDIMQVVEVLRGAALQNGLDPHHLIAPQIPGAWIF